jgi:hypothetical protein
MNQAAALVVVVYRRFPALSSIIRAQSLSNEGMNKYFIGTFVLDVREIKYL